MPDPSSLPGWLLERRSDAASREMVAASFGEYRIRLIGPLNYFSFPRLRRRRGNTPISHTALMTNTLNPLM